MRVLRLSIFSLLATLVVGAAGLATAQPDVSGVAIIEEDDGFTGVCEAPCYVVEKQADFYLSGNPSSPVACAPGDNAFVYTLTHLSNPPSSLPAPGIPVTDVSSLGFSTSVMSKTWKPPVPAP